ncbi:hypothetical protein DINM_003966 [Dirofilaria immitis]|nr:hypothetical protein [Dirofilaria immitis]
MVKINDVEPRIHGQQLTSQFKLSTVALWYQSGEPVMGRIWNDGGKIAVYFGWGGHEYRKNIGSIQILFELPEQIRDFDYAWKPFKKAAQFGSRNGFQYT